MDNFPETNKRGDAYSLLESTIAWIESVDSRMYQLTDISIESSKFI